MRITPPDFKAGPGREERLEGEAKETLFIEDSKEGVKGVFASERARVREGVLDIVVRGKKEQIKVNNAIQT